MPMVIVENSSSEARTGSSVPCEPGPASRIDTPMSNAATGARASFTVAGKRYCVRRKIHALFACPRRG